MHKSPPPGFFEKFLIIWIFLGIAIFLASFVHVTIINPEKFNIIEIIILLFTLTLIVYVSRRTIFSFEYDDDFMEFKFIHGRKKFNYSELTKITVSHSPFTGEMIIVLATNIASHTYDYHCPFYSFSRLDAMEYLIRHLQNIEGYDFELKLGRGLAKFRKTTG